MQLSYGSTVEESYHVYLVNPEILSKDLRLVLNQRPNIVARELFPTRQKF